MRFPQIKFILLIFSFSFAACRSGQLKMETIENEYFEMKCSAEWTITSAKNGLITMEGEESMAVLWPLYTYMIKNHS